MIFTPGDTVQLKSGGVTMTVEETSFEYVRGTQDTGDPQFAQARCVWFDVNGHWQTAVFRMVLLKEAA